MKRILSFILTAAMALSMAIVPSYAASENVETQLATGLYVHQNSFYSTYAEGDINENYFVYTPNTSCTPYLVYGSDVAGAASASRIFRLEGEAGNSLVAAVNADYFVMATGIPIGIEIKDGKIVSSSSYSYPEIGITADGKAQIGRSNLNVFVTNDSRDLTLNYVNYNKALSDAGGVSVFSKDFGSNNYASAGTETLNVLVKITAGEAKANKTITGTVENIYTATEKQSLEEGYLLISTNTSSYVDSQQKMNSFEKGDSVTVHFDMDSSWANVQQAFGGKETLMEGGELKSFTDSTRAPRTAFGIKSDGTIVIYTCDGRDAGGSKGLTLTETARRMKQLGCTDAVNLDGGASTQVHVVFPGNTSQEQINTDSGSYLRSASNYICFKNNLPATGTAVKLYAYPNTYKLAADCSKQLNIKAVDANWHAVSLASENITYSGNKLGTIDSQGVYTAGSDLGEETLTASYGDLSVQLKMTVVSDWPELSGNYQSGYFMGSIVDPTGEGIPSSNITLKLDGETLSFTYDSGSLKAAIPQADGLLHHIVMEAKSSTGHITRFTLAFEANAKILEDGTYETVTADSQTVFSDMNASRWSTSYAEYLYRENIIAGYEKNGYRYYNPEKNMTRQEFAKVIVSWMGTDTSLYEDTELSFDDNSKIDDWALPYVKAAVSLGIMGGKSVNGSLMFDPQGSITRQEVMTVIGKILGSGYGKADLSSFSDNDDVASWAESYAQVLVKLGIINGVNGKLLPENPVTREQVAKIVFEIN